MKYIKTFEMRKKINLLEIQERSNKIHNNSFIIDPNQEYNKMSDKINIFCKKCGDTFKQKVSNHLNNKSGCPKCNGNKKITIEDVINKSKNIFGDKYEIEDQKIENNRSKIKIYCKKCNKYFYQSINTHLSGKGCPICAGNVKLTLNELREKSYKIHGDLYNIPDQEFDNIIEIYCKKCKEYFYQRISDHLKGSGCKKCGIIKRNKKLTLKFEEFSERANKIHNKKYLYFEDTYTNTRNKTKIFCNNCGNVFYQTPSHHLNMHGCPYCLESKGEKTISDYLIYNNIKFKRQKTFDECKYKRVLPFDFYLPEFNMCIEFDGKQHYELFYKRKFDIKSLNDQIIRDNIKDKYCEDNNIKMLRIKYTDNIIEKLKNNIKI
jgi:formylmethanofuran dehydrogenase subunit E/very-short-patch-repair endonuclease